MLQVLEKEELFEQLKAIIEKSLLLTDDWMVDANQHDLSKVKK